MNEIEKLYENAGIKADRIVCYRGFDNCIDNDFNCHCHNKKPYKDATKIYPDFTAENQIELIKWISHHDGCFKVHLNSIEFGNTGLGSRSTFEESLAKAVSNFLMSATEKEKQQIKEILE